MAFTFSRTPAIHFGTKTTLELSKIASRYGSHALLVIGSASLEKSGRLLYYTDSLELRGMKVSTYSVKGEPSPEIINEAVNQFYDECVDVVISIGGGSVIDAGKAISAMLPSGESIINYIEGVGTKVYNGCKIPFIAIPTTSGTGSECTNNAVISKVGRNGFKRSLRHENLVPDVALVDPELTLSCPKSITAACSMDAFAQLIESFVSTQSNAMTDALAWSGLQQMIKNMIPAYNNGDVDLKARIGVAYGAMQSGLALTNAGLCVTHGFASSIGGMFDIPHGIVCGRLLPAALDVTIRELKRSQIESPEAEEMLYKHAVVAQLITGDNFSDIDTVNDKMITKLYDWVEYMELPRLAEYGISENDFMFIAGKTGCKNNPVQLTNEQLCEILSKAL